MWPTAVAIGMAVLQLPDLGQKMLPFAILLGGVFTFVRLSRTRELVATRAAGVSAWDFLLPPLTVAVLIGVLTVTVFTPMSARMFSEFAGLEARYVKGEDSQLSVSMNGLWLRQGDAHQQSVIHALRVAQQGEHLEDVMVLLYGAERPLHRPHRRQVGAAEATFLDPERCLGLGTARHAGASRQLPPGHHPDAGTDRGKLHRARCAVLLGSARLYPRRPGRRLFRHPLPALSLYPLCPARPVRGHGVHGRQLLAASWGAKAAWRR